MSFRQGQRKRLGAAIGAVLLATLTAIGGWYALYQSNVFVVGALDIVIDQFSGDIDVAEMKAEHPDLAVQVADSLASTVGTPLIDVDASSIEGQVKNAVPLAASVSAHRSWPSTLTVAVVPRRPVVAQGTSEKGFELLDNEAVVVATVKKKPDGLVPVSGVTAATASSDTRPHTDQERTGREIVNVAVSIQEPLRQSIRLVSGKTSDSVTLTLTSGRIVVWGNSGQSDMKANVAQVLLDKTDAPVVDVSTPEAPVTRVKP